MEDVRRRFGAITAAQSAELDATARRHGVEVESLMRAAGWQVARCAWEELQRDGGALSVLVLAGNGNNGGDALAAAGHLAAWGCSVHVLTFAAARPRSELWQRLHAAVSRSCTCNEVRDEVRLEGLVGEARLVLDGVLGTGVQGPPRPAQRSVLETAGAVRGGGVLAVDLPSGMDADSGEAYEGCLRADLTCTLAAVKQGLWSDGARALTGRLWVADIGMPLGAWRDIGVEPPVAVRGAALLPVD